MPEQEIAQIVPTTPEPYSPLKPQTWEELTDGAITLPGYELLRDEDTDALVGVPMMLTKASFRSGISRKGKPNYSEQHPVNAYVSIEARLAPAFDIRKINQARKNNGLAEITDISQLPFDPDAHVVINDGSTGIYRQMVALLATANYIDLPDGELAGAHGETILDLTPGEWSEIRAGSAQYDDDGFLTAEFDIRLFAKRGLRISEYEWDADRKAKTRYIA